MDPVVFKSYNLCSGTLVLSIGDTEYVFNKYCMSSGGGTNWQTDTIEKGEWSIVDWPIDFPEDRREEALDVINRNVTHGCCGGCI